jgi:acyl-coenzyme A synthetase/AMP-(fatty) acid ligase/acyl carrier protein
VIGPDGSPRPGGAIGELCVRGPGVISRFVWPEAANEAAFHDSGYRTGDLGRVDDDGLIWITGRIKEQINRGGETLSPLDIEEVLLTHPMVAEAAVFPLPHPGLGEEVAALCVVRHAAALGEAPDAAGLIAFAAELLPFAQVPKAVFFVDALPRAGSGKVSRMAIAAEHRNRWSEPPTPSVPPPRPENALWRRRIQAAFADIIGLAEVDDRAAFFALGGTSLHALRLVAWLEAGYGVRMRPSDLLTHSCVAALAGAIAAGTLRTAASLPADATGGGWLGTAASPPPNLALASGAIPASKTITAIHYAERLYPHPLRGYVVVLTRLAETETYPRVADAFRRVVASQPALRHRAGTDGDGAVALWPIPEDAWPVPADLTVSASLAEIEADPAAVLELRRWLEQTAGHVRAAWIGAPGGGGLLFCALHETIADGFARAMLPVLLEAALAGRALPEARPLGELMAVVRGRESGSSAAAGGDTAASLHQDGTGESRRRAELLEMPLGPTVWQSVEDLARAASVTPFAIAWTALALLLERLAGGPVPLWSALQHRRGQADFATMGNVTTMARFVLAMRPDSFIAAARDAMRQYFQVIGQGGDVPEHDVPGYYFEFEDEVQRLREIHPALTRGDRVRWSRELPESVPDWHLRLAVRPPEGTGPGLLRLIVDPSRFSRPRARSLLEAYAALLEAVLANPFAAPGSLPVAAVYDRPRSWPDVMPAWPNAPRPSASWPNAPRPNAPRPSTPGAGPSDTPREMPREMADLFLGLFRRWPGGKAIVWRDGAMSFLEVAQAADRLGQTLRSLGAGPADVVGFRLTGEVQPTSLALFIVAHVATLRLGCALLPLGQQLAPALARSQIEAVDARFLIAAPPGLDWLLDAAVAVRSTPINGFPGAVLLARPPAEARQSGDNTPCSAILLTSSGTMGTPKTIRLSQAMVAGAMRAIAATRLPPSAPGLLGQNIGFDAITTDIWMPWLSGHPIVALDTERRTPSALAAARSLGARQLTLSPTAATAALNDDPNCFAGFESLMMIGEVVPPTLVRRLAAGAPALRVLNGYGPAENAVLATLADVTGVEDANIPLGPALAGYRVLVVDRELRPLPPHWPGELAIASAAPALGYHDAEMTAARFVELPGEVPGPFFRSGDLGWVDGDGQTRFIGRADRQVKLSGVRVEIDGIEHCIAEVDGVAEAAVVLLEGPTRPRVVAVVQPEAGDGGRDRDALATRIDAHCREWLPRAAVPSELVFVDAMPMGSTSKKSHSALRAMLTGRAEQPATAGREERAVAAIDSIEARLAGLWSDLLGARPGAIGSDDDVFTFGVSSLDALRMVERIERAFLRRFPDHQIFMRRTIRAQAALLRESGPLLEASPLAGSPSALESHLVRLARGPGPSRGIVLGMPLRDGASHFLGVLAENALPDHEIWGFAVRAGDLAEDGAWLDCARAIAARLLAGEGPRPRALIGFSMGGFLGWLVDRLLVAAGWDVTPVVNLDGGALHTKFGGWRRMVESELPPAPAPPARMLLLQRAPFGDFPNQRRTDADWSALGAELMVVDCLTVRHLDVLSAEIYATVSGAMAAHIEAGPLASHPGPARIDFETQGGELFRMLDTAEPPDSGQLRAFLERLPPGPVDEDFRRGLLWLGAACGDRELALSLAGWLAAEAPDDHDAFFAQVLINAALGRHAEAVALTEAWCQRRGPDPEIRERAQKQTSWVDMVVQLAGLFGDGEYGAANPAPRAPAPRAVAA